MTEIYSRLEEAHFLFFEYGITALDAYLDEKPRPLKFLAVQCSLVELARVFDVLEYPNLPYADASLCDEVRFICTEDALEENLGSPWMNFKRSPSTGVYYDKGDIYNSLKARNIQPSSSEYSEIERSLFDFTLLATLSELPPKTIGSIALPPSPSVLFQRDLLIGILSGPYPVSGFEVLKQSGFIAREWPEIALLDNVDHSKDFHPEGNGWNHTMQTFSYRKTRDITLSLALLLHDIGKSESKSQKGHRFDRHAELGAKRAEKFLSRLGFSEEIQEDVKFLIRYHMMPAALPILPVQKTEALIRDPRFSVLLELFRCDEFSSFKNAERYYDACNMYQSIRRNLRNPYRKADGSKIHASKRSYSHFS